MQYEEGIAQSLLNVGFGIVCSLIFYLAIHRLNIGV